MEEFQKLLGYTFKDQGALLRALTHKSCGALNNERLEFLGDSVLNFVAADMIYEVYPRLSEGEMSRVRAALVREETLVKIAGKLGLRRHLRYVEDLQKPGLRPSVLADALEAVFGAMYKEAGLAVAHDVIRRHLLRVLANQEADIAKDSKTRLQEYLQGRGYPLPTYTLTRTQEVMDEHRRFEVRCTALEGKMKSTGYGRTRKAAELDAAGRMIKLLEEQKIGYVTPGRQLAA